MSRHRSPGGRNARRRPDIPAVALPGAPPARVPLTRHRAASAIHNGMSAAAVSGAALAVVIPTMGAAAGPTADTTTAAATLRLAADDRTVAPDGAALGLVTSVVLVAEAPEPEPSTVDVTELIKGAGLADVARQAGEARAAREAAALCDADVDGLGRVKPWVRRAAQFLSCLYDGPRLIGVAHRSRASDHPRGLAIDLMARGETGDRIADCALANRDEFAISYVIWGQRINYGDGWEAMSDRGSDTENHFDHVHISFSAAPGSGVPLAERCG